jgi:uncharacterized membrane protein YfcA
MPPLVALLVLLGCLGGFAAGLLGFGGGVIMFPLLYSVPPLLGFERFDAKTVAAVVVTQVFFSTLVGGAAHFRSQRVNSPLAFTAGTSSAAGAFFGGLASAWVPDRFLLILFAVMTVLVAGMMLLPAPTPQRENIPADQVLVPLIPLSILSLLAGLMIGFLGAGNFVFVPLLIYVMKVPTRVAIGSSLFIALTNTFFGFLGKLVSGQIPYLAAFAVATGGIIGAVAGEWCHRRIPINILRYIYGGMLAVIALQAWVHVLEF